MQSGVVAGMAGVAGCTGLLADPPIDQLEASVFDVRTPSVGATSATLPIVLRLHNAADRKLPNLSGDFSVFINSERVASTKSHFGTLTAGEASKQPIKPVIEYAKSGGAIVDAFKRGQFRVEIDAEFQSKGATKTTRITYQYS